MHSKASCHVKAYHTFLVYLPVILIMSLIMVIYIGYIFTYISVLINSGSTINYKTQNKYVFNHTSSSFSAFKKGISLVIIVTFCFVMLLISLIKTIFVNPGYFPSPLELEYKIVLKNTNYQGKIKSDKKKNYSQLKEEDDTQNLYDNSNYKYITDFKYIVEETPMTTTEEIALRSNINKIIEFDKKDKKGNFYFGNDNSNTSLSIEKPYIDPYSRFEGIDFSKVILCGTCLRFKVERSHHCRQCGRCVLKMDHHCPWLANCIGFRNYKYFCLVHLYGLIGTLLICFTYWEVIINQNIQYSYSIYQIAFSSFIYIANFSLFSFCLWLFIVNWRLVFAGQTVIENSDRERFPSTKSINIYDLGWYNNFKAVFGNNPLLWLIPFFPNYRGDGVVFENIFSQTTRAVLNV